MNGADLAHRIRLYEGADFDPFEEEPSYPYAGLIIVAGAILSWAALIGAGYCFYRAWTALHG